MLPIASEYPVRGPSPITWTIIALCGLVALGQLADPQDDAIFRYGARPALIAFDLLPWNADTLHVAFTVLSSMFLHAGIWHVIGNMLFFHCFSMPVESLMGSWRYALFYLLCGIASTLTYSLGDPDSFTPLVGASGAVAGVLAAHTVLLPWTKIRVPSSILGPDHLPAWLFTLMWVAYQAVFATNDSSGVAWVAHLGGVGAGLMLAPLFCRPGVRLFSHGPAGTYDDGSPLPGEAPPEAAAFADANFASVSHVPHSTSVPSSTEEKVDGYRLSTIPSVLLALMAFAALAGWMFSLPGAVDRATRARADEWIALSRLNGLLVPENVPSALALYREAAALDPEVAVRLAKNLQSGTHMPRSEAEALEWFRRAAEQKQPQAMEVYAMAQIENGNSKAERDHGADLLRQLARDDYSSGDYRLGMVLEQGLGGTTVDPAGAAEHFERGCANKEWSRAKRTGIQPSCYRLALLMFKGSGVARDLDKARELLRTASESGLPEAENAYALYLLTGDPESRAFGTTESPHEAQARRLLEAAAKAGNKDAVNNLALLKARRQ